MKRQVTSGVIVAVWLMGCGDHWWTGDRHEGPATIEIDAPIGAPPVFSPESDRPDLRID